MLCTICKVDKPIEEFATYFHSTQQKLRRRKQCTSCCYARSREYKRNMRLKLKEKELPYQERYSKLLDEFQSKDYRQNPNEYVCDEQRELVHIMMENMFGWTWNEDTKTWSKEGVKDKNNNWFIFRRNPPKKIEGKKWFSPEFRKHVKEQTIIYKKLGKTYLQIAKMFDISDTSIYRILNDE